MTIWKSITKAIPLVCNIHNYILWKNALVHIPMCQSEFGPGTEYGRHAVSPLGLLKATFKGSRVCSACRTLSLHTAGRVVGRLSYTFGIMQLFLSPVLSPWTIPTRDYEHLCQQVNPLASSENYGIEVYEDIAFSH